MAHLLRAAAAFFLAMMGAALEGVALLLLVGAGIVVVVTLPQLWYEGSADCFPWAMILGAISGALYLMAHGLRRARVGLWRPEPKSYGFEIRPVSPERARLR